MELGGLTFKIVARKAMMLVGAAAALAACAVTAVVALAFTVYALLREVVGPAGAAACVVGVVCVIAGLAAFIAYRQVGPPRRLSRDSVSSPPRMSTVDRIAQAVRDRPIIAAGAALAAGLMALRNPVLVAAVVRALTQPPRTRR